MNPAGRDISAKCALEIMPSGIFLPPNAVHTSERVLVNAIQHADGDISDLVNKFAMMQLHYPYLKPIFLISAHEPSDLARAGFIYESALTETAWNELEMDASYREYAERRVHEMISVYRTGRVAAVLPGQDIPRWLYER